MALFPLLTSLPATAHAQADADRATARSLGLEGQQALDSRDFKTAEDRFRRADNLVHAPTLMLGLARALAGEGRYVEAQETYNRIIREGVAPGAPDAFKRALADAKKEVEGVSPKIGGVTITVRAASGGEVPAPKVVLDGAPVNAASLGVRRSVDPGSHTLQVSAEGFKSAELHFDVPESGSIDESVKLEPEPAAPAAVSNAAPGGATTASVAANPESPASPSGADGGGGGARAVLPWVAFGVGGASLALGAVTGILAMGKHSDLTGSGQCSGSTCDPSQQSNLDSYHALATVSTVGFIAGGVGVAAGVVLLVTRPRAEGAAVRGVRVVPVVGLGGVGAAGTF
ncbi:MAG: hypothetical protein JOZ69_10355 [Myxococcales bacterium]|nr:hypothetical protein [Myxococcales bacterium]